MAGRVARQRPVLLVGLLMLLGVLSSRVFAVSDVGELVSQLRQGQVTETELQWKGMQSADRLFLLGWLYQQGRYGVMLDLPRGQALIQQAAEQGQFDAMHYCWQHCLELTPGVLSQLQLGSDRNQAQAQYLQSQLPVGSAAGTLSADQLLLAAARQGHPQAIGRLYVDHFVTWAEQVHTLDEAVTKLQRCVTEGVVVCYYLLGALYERHNDHQQALFYYELLALIDPALYQRYVGDAHRDRLLDYLPQQGLALPLLQSRSASYLSQRDASGNQQIDRFKRCGTDYSCAFRLSQADQACLLEYFEATHLRGLRDSDGYRACAAMSALR